MYFPSSIVIIKHRTRNRTDVLELFDCIRFENSIKSYEITFINYYLVMKCQTSSDYF